MQITILTNGDLPSVVALNILVPQLAHHDLSIFFSSSVGRDRTNMPKGLVVLKYAEQAFFTEVVFPDIDRGDQPYQTDLRTFAGLAATIVKPVEVLNDINHQNGYRRLSDRHPDLIISIRYGVILKETVIGLPKYGVLNLHSGLLPQYRGVMATFWAMLNGDKQIGTTLHTIDDAGIDSGQIIAHTTRSVDTSRSYLWHVMALYPDGCRLVVDSVACLSSGSALERRPQKGPYQYYTFPTEDDISNFVRQGFRLYDSNDLLHFWQRFTSPVAGSPPL